MTDSYSVGVLTVSDRCFQGEAEDESGPLLQKLLETSNKLKYPKCVLKCVPDEQSQIEETLKEWADVRRLDAVFTTGGTGFAARDVTPEATRNVIEKEAPAIPAAILFQSLNKTKMAMLSRAVCGVRKNCLITNFPGSKKAVGECFNIVEDCLPHALSLLRNNIQSISAVHKTLHKPIKSKVDISKVARRARESPFPMVSVEDSISVIQAVVARLIAGSTPTQLIEQVSIQDAVGHVIVAPITAACSLPPYRASVKDGYAAIASDGAGPRTVISASVAGTQPGGADEAKLKPSQCVRVSTGAPVPAGGDCVVQVEDTRVLQESEDGTEELQIEVIVAPSVGQDIREIGSDVHEGDVVLSVTRTPLTSSQVGLLVSVGVFKLPVVKLPRVAVLSTGNELQLPGRALSSGQIYDSNKVVLLSLLKQHGFPATDLGIATDEPDEVLAKLMTGMEVADVIITTGSVSMGERDLLKHVLKDDINAEIHFGRVNLKPGKPTTFASCVMEGGRTVLFFCLPGNPVSATVTCHLYVLPVLRQLAGHKLSEGQIVKAQIQSELKLDPRVEFKRGVYKTASDQTPATVQVVGGHMLSSNLLSVSTANCLVHLPACTKQTPVLAKESWVDCWLTGDL